MVMSVRPMYFSIQALKGLKKNLLATFIAVTTVALSMIVLGSFIAIAVNVSNIINQIERKVEITVWLLDTANSEEIFDLENKIRRMEEVQSVKYISKDEALERFRTQLKNQPDLLKALEGNPLPASFEIGLKDPKKVNEVAKRIESDNSIIDDIRYGQQIVERLFAATRILRWVGAIFITILCLASLVVIANTIRLAIFARRAEISIMKLVGATNWFIRWPFALEGVIQGLLGAATAVFLFFLMNKYVFGAIADTLKFLNAGTPVISITQISLYILLAGTMIGAIGSMIAMRRYLRI